MLICLVLKEIWLKNINKRLENQVRVREENPVPKKKYNKGAYPVQDFIRDIEYHYFTPKQQKFWLFYKTVDSEPTFKEVNPIVNPLIKVNDYRTQRNVIYDYHRNDQMIPIVDDYKIVKYRIALVE